MIQAPFNSNVCNFHQRLDVSRVKHNVFFLPGNAVLLVIYAVMGHDSNKSDRGDLALYNILQIIFTVEFIISVPGILWYLGKLCKYSKHFKTNFSIDLRAWSL